MPRITYFLRPNKDKQKSFSLYCRVTYLGDKTEFSLQEKVDHSNWSQENQEYIGTKARKLYIDTLLEITSCKIKTAAILKDHFNVQELVRFCYRSQQKKPMLADMVKMYIARSQEHKRGSTMKSYLSKLNNLIEYQKHSKVNYTAAQFSVHEAEKYIGWFQERAKTKNQYTASRNITLFKAALSWAMREGKIDSNPLELYSAKKDKPKPVVYLSEDELQLFLDKMFQDPMYEQVRQTFLFQCFTGLAYSDLWGEWSFEISTNGVIMSGYRAKNDKLYAIPLHPVAKQVLSHFNGQIPRIDNSTYNKKLKIVSALCGCQQDISTHTGRSTFASLKDSEGWTRESVSRMLGHSSTRTTERYYIGSSGTRVENEMNQRIA